MENYQENSRRTRRVRDVSTVLAHLSLERTDLGQQEFDTVYHPFQHDVEDTQTGFDDNGDWHFIGGSSNEL
jgi:hypothetical protein